MSLTPYRINVADSVLSAIRQKVAAYEWHEMPEGQEPEDTWAYGTNRTYLQKLCAYWLKAYDWRKWEEALNRFPQYTARVDDLDIHFYLEPGSGPAPRPLLLLHGWPGSVFEFLDLIEPLAHPERFGGDVKDAFTVIVPSLPGYGFSGKPKAPIGPRATAAIMDKLMREQLGLPQYLVQGGDWGAIIAGWLGYEGQGCQAVHMNLQGWTPSDIHPETEEEKAHFAKWLDYRRGEIAYADIQRTKPQTLSYAMMDSPVGVCAWIVEKFRTWSDIRKGFENVHSFDRLLTNVMIYLVTRTFNTASWMYYGRGRESKLGYNLPPRARIEKPVGVANFPFEFLPWPPRSYVERCMNVVHWTDFDAGGHFPALECGSDLVEDVRRFARHIEY
jgi:pimeloyl-ACP methyl ester carboxylesterase